MVGEPVGESGWGRSYSSGNVGSDVRFVVGTARLAAGNVLCSDASDSDTQQPRRRLGDEVCTATQHRVGTVTSGCWFDV